MSIKPSHFRKMIADTLNRFNPELAGPAAIELLMMTAGHETHLGGFLYQDNSAFGPAIGFYQIEPATHYDVCKYYLGPKFPDFKPRPDRDLLDPQYSTIICRGIYARRHDPLPDAGDIIALAHYYKKFFNTPAGSAEIDQVIKNYLKYAR